MANENKPAKNDEDVPEELKPTVLLMSIMVKIKVAPVVDEDDQETLQEKLSELLNDETFGDVVSYFLSDEENVKELGWEPDDVELVTENCVFEVSE